MSPWWIVAISGGVYACAAFLAIKGSAALCHNVVPFDDGPSPGRPPVVGLIVGAALVGVSLARQGLEFPALALGAVLTVSLVACWYSDVRCGIVPDYFTLVPLGIVLAVALLSRNVAPLISAGIVFVPFAIAALLSKGYGMGWGDVKLVALGAAVLGLQTSILAFATACLGAVVVAAVRKRRTQPVAFAPYLASATAVALAFPIFPR